MWISSAAGEGLGASFGARAATEWCLHCALCFDPVLEPQIGIFCEPPAGESPGGVCSPHTELLRMGCATFPLQNQECLVWEEPRGAVAGVGVDAKLGFAAIPESSQGTPGRGQEVLAVGQEQRNLLLPLP